jgi:hypothetical protein
VAIYKFTSPVHKTPIVSTLGRGQSRTLVGGLAGGMAHIHCENCKFTDVKGLVPMPTYSHSPNLCHGDLGSVARDRHSLKTAPDGSILEFTYIGGQHPL